MRIISDFNDGWLFEGRETVHLPHSAVELPFSYFDETVYQRPFKYEKTFLVPPEWAGREVWLRFDGAMANAKVWLDDQEIACHLDGYTPFKARLTGIAPGEHQLRVVIDGTENPNIPPFGNVIDYLTYAGLYREVWLEVATPLHIENVKIETSDVLKSSKSVQARIQLANPENLPFEGALTGVVRDSDGHSIASAQARVEGAEITLEFDGLDGVSLWTLENPALYVLDLKLETKAGTDSYSARFGFREIAFTKDGFSLNGKPLKLRGLNRHQSFPYAGYALGRAAQEKDAEILKRELRVNMVRTSHYPQSTYFLDRCDELGLLVFEEIPGWQHIGDLAWQDESVRNVERMIRRDWNHPSIVIWGGANKRERGQSRFLCSDERTSAGARSNAAHRGREIHHEFGAFGRRLHYERLRARRRRKEQKPTQNTIAPAAGSYGIARYRSLYDYRV